MDFDHYNNRAAEKQISSSRSQFAHDTSRAQQHQSSKVADAQQLDLSAASEANYLAAHSNKASSRYETEEREFPLADDGVGEDGEAFLSSLNDGVNSSHRVAQRLLSQQRQHGSVGRLHSAASDNQLSRLPFHQPSTRTASVKRLPSNTMKQSSAANSTSNGRASLAEYSSGFGSNSASPTALKNSPQPFGTMNGTADGPMQQQQYGGGEGERGARRGGGGGLIMRPVRQPSVGQAPPDQLYYTQIQQQQQTQFNTTGGAAGTPRRSSLAQQNSDANQQQPIQNGGSRQQQQFGSAVVGGSGRRQSRGSTFNEEVLTGSSPMVQRRMMQPPSSASSVLHQALMNDSNVKRVLSNSAAAVAARHGSMASGGGEQQYGGIGGPKFALMSKLPSVTAYIQQQQQLQQHSSKIMDESALGQAQQLSEDGEIPDASFEAFEKLTYADLIPYNQSSVEPTREFLREGVELMLQYLESEASREHKILNFKHPIKMLQTFDFTLPQDGFPLSQILRDMRETLSNAVRTGHPHFFNQLSSGKEIVSLAGDWLTSTTNSNMFTYEISPVYVIMEAETLRHMREIIGWPGGEGDGIFSPGGTLSNLYAVNAARHKKFPQVKQKGMSILPRLVMFTSEQSHYSIKGAAAITGIGTSNVVEVHADERGKMIASELEREVRAALDRGDMPFFVNATAGTTVLGAYDPIHEIADICDKYDMWLHVDGAWGAGCLMSPKLRRGLVDGIERADSITWNPHKLMGALLQCSAILVREPGTLFSCNQMCADYLYQQDKHYDVKYDTGDRAIQCGRHVDIFKLWLMWRAFGDNGFAARVEHLWAMRDYLLEQLKSRQDFWLVLEEFECTNVCFWYIPPSLAEVERSPKLLEKLGKIIPVIKARMMDRGTMMIGYQPASGKPNFFRVIISNAAIGKEDIDFMIDEIVELGKDM